MLSCIVLEKLESHLILEYYDSITSNQNQDKIRNKVKLHYDNMINLLGKIIIDNRLLLTENNLNILSHLFNLTLSIDYIPSCFIKLIAEISCNIQTFDTLGLKHNSKKDSLMVEFLKGYYKTVSSIIRNPNVKREKKEIFEKVVSAKLTSNSVNWLIMHFVDNKNIENKCLEIHKNLNTKADINQHNSQIILKAITQGDFDFFDMFANAFKEVIFNIIVECEKKSSYKYINKYILKIIEKCLIKISNFEPDTIKQLSKMCINIIDLFINQYERSNKINKMFRICFRIMYIIYNKNSTTSNSKIISFFNKYYSKVLILDDTYVSNELKQNLLYDFVEVNFFICKRKSNLIDFYVFFYNMIIKDFIILNTKENNTTSLKNVNKETFQNWILDCISNLFVYEADSLSNRYNDKGNNNELFMPYNIDSKLEQPAFILFLHSFFKQKIFNLNKDINSNIEALNSNKSIIIGNADKTDNIKSLIFDIICRILGVSKDENITLIILKEITFSHLSFFLRNENCQLLEKLILSIKGQNHNQDILSHYTYYIEILFNHTKEGRYNSCKFIDIIKDTLPSSIDDYNNFRFILKLMESLLSYIQDADVSLESLKKNKSKTKVNSNLCKENANCNIIDTNKKLNIDNSHSNKKSNVFYNITNNIDLLNCIIGLLELLIKYIYCLKDNLKPVNKFYIFYEGTDKKYSTSENKKSNKYYSDIEIKQKLLNIISALYALKLLNNDLNKNISEDLINIKFIYINNHKTNEISNSYLSNKINLFNYLLILFTINIPPLLFSRNTCHTKSIKIELNYNILISLKNNYDLIFNEFFNTDSKFKSELRDIDINTLMYFLIINMSLICKISCINYFLKEFGYTISNKIKKKTNSNKNNSKLKNSNTFKKSYTKNSNALYTLLPNFAKIGTKKDKQITGSFLKNTSNITYISNYKENFNKNMYMSCDNITSIIDMLGDNCSVVQLFEYYTDNIIILHSKNNEIFTSLIDKYIHVYLDSLKRLPNTSFKQSLLKLDIITLLNNSCSYHQVIRKKSINLIELYINNFPFLLNEYEIFEYYISLLGIISAASIQPFNFYNTEINLNINNIHSKENEQISSYNHLEISSEEDIKSSTYKILSHLFERGIQKSHILNSNNIAYNMVTFTSKCGLVESENNSHNLNKINENSEYEDNPFMSNIININLKKNEYSLNIMQRIYNNIKKVEISSFLKTSAYHDPKKFEEYLNNNVYQNFDKYLSISAISDVHNFTDYAKSSVFQTRNKFIGIIEGKITNLKQNYIYDPFFVNIILLVSNYNLDVNIKDIYDFEFPKLVINDYVYYVLMKDFCNRIDFIFKNNKMYNNNNNNKLNKSNFIFDKILNKITKNNNSNIVDNFDSKNDNKIRKSKKESTALFSNNSPIKKTLNRIQNSPFKKSIRLTSTTININMRKKSMKKAPNLVNIGNFKENINKKKSKSISTIYTNKKYYDTKEDINNIILELTAFLIYTEINNLETSFNKKIIIDETLKLICKIPLIIGNNKSIERGCMCWEWILYFNNSNILDSFLNHMILTLKNNKINFKKPYYLNSIKYSSFSTNNKSDIFDIEKGFEDDKDKIIDIFKNNTYKDILENKQYLLYFISVEEYLKLSNLTNKNNDNMLNESPIIQLNQYRTDSSNLNAKISKSNNLELNHIENSPNNKLESFKENNKMTNSKFIRNINLRSNSILVKDIISKYSNNHITSSMSNKNNINNAFNKNKLMFLNNKTLNTNKLDLSLKKDDCSSNNFFQIGLNNNKHNTINANYNQENYFCTNNKDFYNDKFNTNNLNFNTTEDNLGLNLVNIINQNSQINYIENEEYIEAQIKILKFIKECMNEVCKFDIQKLSYIFEIMHYFLDQNYTVSENIFASNSYIYMHFIIINISLELIDLVSSNSKLFLATDLEIYEFRSLIYSFGFRYFEYDKKRRMITNKIMLSEIEQTLINVINIILKDKNTIEFIIDNKVNNNKLISSESVFYNYKNIELNKTKEEKKSRNIIKKLFNTIFRHTNKKEDKNNIKDNDEEQTFSKKMKLRNNEKIKNLLVYLIESEISNLRYWNSPNTSHHKEKDYLPTSNTLKDDRVKEIFEAAFLISDKLSIKLVERYPWIERKFKEYINKLEQNIFENSEEFYEFSYALKYYINYLIKYEEKFEINKNDNFSCLLNPNLLFWKLPSLNNAFKYLSLNYSENYQLHQLAILRILSKASKTAIIFYMPEIIQTLRTNTNNVVEKFIIELCIKSSMIAHQFLWNLEVEEIMGFKTKDNKFLNKHFNDWIYIKAKTLKMTILKNFNPMERKFWDEVSSYFDLISNISGKYLHTQEDMNISVKDTKEKKNKFVYSQLLEISECSKHRFNHVYLPTNPDTKLIELIPSSCKTLQSAKKVPFIVSFKSIKFKGPDYEPLVTYINCYKFITQEYFNCLSKLSKDNNIEIQFNYLNKDTEFNIRREIDYNTLSIQKSQNCNYKNAIMNNNVKGNINTVEENINEYSNNVNTNEYNRSNNNSFSDLSKSFNRSLSKIDNTNNLNVKEILPGVDSIDTNIDNNKNLANKKSCLDVSCNLTDEDVYTNANIVPNLNTKTSKTNNVCVETDNNLIVNKNNNFDTTIINEYSKLNNQNNSELLSKFDKDYNITISKDKGKNNFESNKEIDVNFDSLVNVNTKYKYKILKNDNFKKELTELSSCTELNESNLSNSEIIKTKDIKSYNKESQNINTYNYNNDIESKKYFNSYSSKDGNNYINNINKTLNNLFKGNKSLRKSIDNYLYNNSNSNNNNNYYEDINEMSCIFKVGDDLRQDALALQIIHIFKEIFLENKLNLYLFPYKTISTISSNCKFKDLGGMIEVIPNCDSRDMIGRTYHTNLFEFFTNQFGQEDSIEFKTAKKNFVESLAAYAVVCYILQIKDRHNGNIMIDTEGHIIHIDFGFIFDISPAKNLRFEKAGFKLTKEMTNIIGGKNSETYAYFEELAIRGYLAARENMDKLIDPVFIMFNSGLDCFKKDSITKLIDRFKIDKNEDEAALYFKDIIEYSYDNWRTNVYDYIQNKQNKISY